MQPKTFDRILFVDIDGVFNKLFGQATNVNVGTIPGDFMDVDLVKFVARMLRTNSSAGQDVKVVGCSSWFSPGRPEKNNKLFSRIESETRLVISDVVRDTGGWKGRCKAVLDYVVEHEPKYWCVIDDGDYYNGQLYVNHEFFKTQPYYNVKQNVVQTHGRYGMSNQDIESMLAILGLSDWNRGVLNQRSIQLDFEEELKRISGDSNV